MKRFTAGRHKRPPEQEGSGLQLAFSHLNLCRNPFGELDLPERQGIAVTHATDFVDSLALPGFALQFIGDKGRGKTSNLLALRRCFPSAPYVHIGEGETPGIPRGIPLFIDEAQRLPWRMRKTLFMRKTSFVLATHRNLGRELRRAGFSVHTLHPGRALTPDDLADMFHRRIEHVRRGPGPVPAIRNRTVRELMTRYGDDVRRMEGDLYERFQSMERMTNV
jgi:hypothetical protein